MAQTSHWFPRTALTTESQISHDSFLTADRDLTLHLTDLRRL
jgi:hypothetical protein